MFRFQRQRQRHGHDDQSFAERRFGPGLRELPPRCSRCLRQVPSLKDVSAAQDNGDRESSVRVDREKAKDYGFSRATTWRNSSRSRCAACSSRISTAAIDRFPVWLRFRGADAQSLDDLSDFKLRRPTTARRFR